MFFNFECRYNLNERKKFFEAIDISKATGASIEVLLFIFLLSIIKSNNNDQVDNQNRSVNGFLLPPGVFLTYLYTDPNTNLDMCALFCYCFLFIINIFIQTEWAP